MGNSEKSLLNSGIKDKSEWIENTQPNIPSSDEYGNYDDLFITSIEQISIYQVI